MNMSQLSQRLYEAGIAFHSIGGELATAPRTLSWSGVTIRIDGLADEQVTAAQDVLDSHPLNESQIAAHREALVREAFAIASKIIDGFYPDRALVDMLAMLNNPANASRTTFLAALSASQTWTEAVRNRAAVLITEINAGARHAVTEADFLTVGTPDHNYLDLLAWED